MGSSIAKHRRPDRIALLALATAAIVLAPAPAAEAGKKKFDLRVTRADNRDFVVTPDRIRVEYAVRNVGRKSVERATLKITFRELIGELPALNPSFTETVELLEMPPDRVEDGAATFAVPVGRYEVKVCVKFKRDKRNGNDCKNGRDFSAIPQSWEVNSANSSAPLHSRPGSQATQNSTADDGTAFYYQQRSAAEFTYAVAGSVTFYVDGTDPENCAWSGSKTVAVSGDKLIFSEDLLRYRFVPATFANSYTATAECPPPIGTTHPPVISGPWLTGFPQSRDRSTKTTISGSAALGPGIPGSYSWSLSAQ